MVTNLWPIALRSTKPVAVEQCVEAQIQERFLQPPELFRHDMTQLAHLRTEATHHTEADTILAAKLASYYKQLKYIARKFHDDLWEATWTDPSHGSTTCASLAFERCNVLYNLAAAYATMGLAEDRRTLEGLQRSHAKLQQAAGLFARLSEEVEQASAEVQMPPDMSQAAVQSLTQLTLAEAQECIWQKAVMDRMRDKLVAQLSQQVSDFYKAALAHHQQSHAIDSRYVHHLSLKSAHFAAAAHFRMSNHAVAQQLYGEEVARLRLAREICNAAASHRDYVATPIASDFAGLVERITSTLERAERDNDIIYMIPVPSASQLAGIVPTSMVKPLLGDALKSSLDEEQGQLFASLLSSVVSNVLAIYNQRKEQLILTRATQPMDKLSSEMTDFLQARSLPGVLTALEQPLGLPQNILRAAEHVKGRGGIDHLKMLLNEGQSLATANIGLLEQIADMMDEEAEEDAALRSQYNSKDYHLVPSSEAFAAYRTQLKHYEELVAKAQKADAVVAQKVQDWERSLEVLGGDKEQLAMSVPDAQKVSLSPAAAASAQRVRQLLTQWESLQIGRQQTLDRIQQYAGSDEPKERLLQEAGRFDAARPIEAGDFEPFMERQLDRYEALLQPLAEQASIQRTLRADLEQATAQFMTHREAASEGTQARQSALQQLSQAATKFDEICANLAEGAKFYHDLHNAANTFADEVRERIEARQRVAEQADSKIVEALEGVQLSGKDEAKTQIEDEPARDVLMTGVWKPEDGIRLANQSIAKEQVATPKKSASNLFNPAMHSIQFGKR